MAIRNDASLRGKIRAIAKREGLRPQEVLQMFLFEHLLVRLEKTSYVDKFILKGGLLIIFDDWCLSAHDDGYGYNCCWYAS